MSGYQLDSIEGAENKKEKKKGNYSAEQCKIKV